MEPRGDFFDYDPFTGLAEYYEETPDGKVHIHTYQDVEPVIDYAKGIANGGYSDDSWKKQDWALYAVIPAIVQLQLYRKGINILDPNAVGRVFSEINTNYPHLKTTFKHHEVRTS
jgi:hypothetical protein